MGSLAEGGAKGEPGKTSSGIRGGEDVSLRRLAPFGGLTLLVQPPCHCSSFKNPRKNTQSLASAAEKCEQSRTQLSTANDTLWSAAACHRFRLDHSPAITKRRQAAALQGGARFKGVNYL